MERLTNTTENRKGNDPFSYWLKDDHPIGVANGIRKLADYEDAEENGMLIKLPCRVGTHIYIVNRRWHVVEAGHICGISKCDNLDCLCYRVYVDPDTYTDILISDFGKEWFLKEPEAEQALAKMEGEN